MSSVISSTGRRPALLIAGILLIATTLRVVFTGAAPLLDAIRSDYGLTTAQTGLPAGSAWNAACCWRCC